MNQGPKGAGVGDFNPFAGMGSSPTMPGPDTMTQAERDAAFFKGGYPLSQAARATTVPCGSAGARGGGARRRGASVIRSYGNARARSVSACRMRSTGDGPDSYYTKEQHEASKGAVLQMRHKAAGAMMSQTGHFRFREVHALQNLDRQDLWAISLGSEN